MHANGCGFRHHSRAGRPLVSRLIAGILVLWQYVASPAGGFLMAPARGWDGGTPGPWCRGGVGLVDGVTESNSESLVTPVAVFISCTPPRIACSPSR